MSNIRNPQPSIQFFHRSGPMACPYLDGRVERKLFTRIPTDPVVAQRLNADLSKAGFRRSHDIMYKPICDRCAACVPVRIPVQRYRTPRSIKRIQRDNADLAVFACPSIAGEEDFALFRRYQKARHPDSDMARMTESDYRAMVEEGSNGTVMFQFRERGGTSTSETPPSDMPWHDQSSWGALAGVMIADRLDDGFSAVYSFFEPDGSRDGLGTLMIATLIDQARQESLDNVYLGYWIEGSRKMAYKTRFRPIEHLTADGWSEMTESDSVT